ncbi:MAG: class I SAM-dependent methyltransferase [Alistipes sp.]|nr:class I SAM-dependent methyltransferase [Alistipes sp.]
MKENKYDQEGFFAAYSRFPRSERGLAAAGEWHRLRRLFPSTGGKRVLDIGCGFGWHCAYAAGQGAAYVLGTDISGKMLAEARRRNPHPVIEYRRRAMEELEFPDGSFDVVVSSLAFHYTPAYGELCCRIYRWLTPGGELLFSVEHPVFTAEGRQQWAETVDGGTVWPVDNYFTEGPREAEFLGHTVIKYHRTLTTYTETLLQAGFIITAIEEPRPELPSPEIPEQMRDELRRPMMLIVAARKPADAQC